MTTELPTPERARLASAITLRLDATAENVMLVRQAVDGAARQFGASDAVVEDLKLAVTEACSNVVRYAYRGREGLLEVEVDPLADGFCVRVRDSGSWLERGHAESADGGLGVPLMEAVSRRCVIDQGEHGTTVELEFPLERSAGGEDD